VAEALTCDNQTAEFLLQSQEESEVVKPEDLMSKLISSKSQFIVWVAQGFGIGRIPFAPGTWGSMLGVVWSVLLLRYCSPALFASVIVLSSLLAVWICGEAEKILGVSDPGSVVLDEIVAMPLAYFGVELLAARSAGDWGLGLFDRPTSPVEPTPGLLLLLAIGFGLFRLFDIWKPWPIRRLQYLPGGWGVVVDDLAAALVAGLIFLLGLAAVLPILAPPTK
jgi:phosphatidylglycerophosphatase A